MSSHKVKCEYYERIDYDKIAICRIGRFGGLVSDGMCGRCPLNANHKLKVIKDRPIRQIKKSDDFFKPLLAERAEKMNRAIRKTNETCSDKK
jgi:hypothetical protein